MLLIVLIIILLVVSRHLYLYHTGDMKAFMVWLKGNFGWKSALIAGLIYIVLLSVPFLPGVELAWLVIMIFGKDAVIMIYVFTIFGFCLSFAVGRRFEKLWLTFGLNVQALQERFIDRTDRIKRKLTELLPSGLMGSQSKFSFLKPQYILLAVLINLPGNAIIGGGGGIALLCGMNRSFSWKGFIVTVVLAVSPLPILLYMGLIQVEAFTR